MTGDFNIRNNFWDPNFPHHSYYKDTLFEIADSLGLEISKPIENIPTRYSDNSQDTDSVIDLIFLHPNSSELDNYHIHLNWRLLSDHTPISINIPILEEHIQTKKQTLVKNSDEESQFVEELITSIKNIDISLIQSADTLEAITQLFANSIKRLWFKYSKNTNITKHFKPW